MMFMVRSIFWLGLVFSTMDWSSIGETQNTLAQDMSAKTQSLMTSALTATSSACSSDLQACALVLSQTQSLANSASEAASLTSKQTVPATPVVKSSPQSPDKATAPKTSTSKQTGALVKSEKVKTAHLDQGLQKASSQKALPN